VQVVIALVVTAEGLPLAYEVLPGNTADKTTLRSFLERIQQQYGKARRIWLMDRGIPTEAVLTEMRQADPPPHSQELVSATRSRAIRNSQIASHLRRRAPSPGLTCPQAPTDPAEIIKWLPGTN
jgi:hypothetical protein